MPHFLKILSVWLVMKSSSRESETDGQTPAAASYYRHVTQKFHGNRIFISRMLNRNPKRLSAEVFSSAQKQPKQNASSQNREENGSTTLRNTREKPLPAGYHVTIKIKIFPISILFTCHVLACELQPFSCHELANDIFSQTAKTVFSHLKPVP